MRSDNDLASSEPSPLSERGRHFPLQAFGTDIRVGFRKLFKHPGLTIVGTVSIAVAVGGAAVFRTFTDNLLHPDLPLDEGDRVVALQSWNIATNSPDRRTLHDFTEWRERLTSVEDLGAFAGLSHAVTIGDEPYQSVRGAEITASAFRLARIAPLLGRPLVQADEERPAEPVAVLGHDLWRAGFGADPAIVGKSIRIGGLRHTVVGVMPDGFAFPFNQNLWVPLKYDPAEFDRGEGPAIAMFGRLEDGVSIENAQAELSLIGRQAAFQFPDRYEFLRARVVPFTEALLTGPSAVVLAVRATFIVFLAVVCANIGAMIFVRNLEREDEMVLRFALGARRGRIVAQLFLETLVLASVGSVAGLALASQGIGLASAAFARVVLDSGVGGLPFWWQYGLNSTIIYYVAVLTVLSATVAAVVPAMTVTKLSLRSGLQRASSGGSNVRFGRRAQAALIVQVALCVGLLTVAVGEWPNMVGNETSLKGFAASEYLAARVQMNGAEREAEVRGRRSGQVRRELRERLLENADVRGVTFASALPGMSHSLRSVEVGGQESTTSHADVRAAAVDTAFFRVMGIPALRGRTLDSGDFTAAGAALPVAVVNESFIRQHLRGDVAVGQHIRLSDGESEASEWLEIVGVVPDFGMRLTKPDSAQGVYVPLADAPVVTVGIRLRTEPEEFTSVLHSTSSEVSPGVRLSDVVPLDAVVAGVKTGQRIYFLITLLSTGTLLLLSLAGVYASMSYLVARRTREIGIRRALGAPDGRIVVDIFSRAVKQVGLGALLGAVLTIPLSAVAMEVGSVGGSVKVAVLLVAAGLLACAAPTWRILRVQPTDAMRAE